MPDAVVNPKERKRLFVMALFFLMVPLTKVTRAILGASSVCFPGRTGVEYADFLLCCLPSLYYGVLGAARLHWGMQCFSLAVLNNRKGIALGLISPVASALQLSCVK